MGFFGDPQSRIPIPGMRDGDFSFLSPGIGDFYPRDWGLFGDFLSPEFFGDGDFSGHGIFFSWDGISHQKAISVR